MVATGHYFGGILWIPVTVGLFIFAFSSAYFTASKNGHEFSLRKYWAAKANRLLPKLLMVNTFLLILFLILEKQNILSWQSIVAMAGMSGLLNWFNITNPSPFGAGLWFFTLLLLFYLIYPLLAFINKSKKYGLIFLSCAFTILTFLNYTVSIGHMLWFTMFAFVFGSYAGFHHLKMPPIAMIFLLVTSLFLMVTVNHIYQYSEANYFFLLLISFSLVAYLLNKKLTTILKHTLLLSSCVMEIYFIHTYLFLHDITPNIYLNYIASLTIIIISSFVLSFLSSKTMAHLPYTTYFSTNR